MVSPCIADRAIGRASAAGRSFVLQAFEDREQCSFGDEGPRGPGGDERRLSRAGRGTWVGSRVGAVLQQDVEDPGPSQVRRFGPRPRRGNAAIAQALSRGSATK